MRTIQKIAEIQSQIATWHNKGKQVALVPTMGNLHDGHLSLIRQAMQRADHTIVTIFVNPMQFGKNEDFAQYPRTPQQDSKKLFEIGVDLLFTPKVPDIYPHDMESATKVDVSGYSEILCGACRPGHFTGVATIVTKLFNIIQPDVALFGEKDYQQLLIIRRVCKDLHIPVSIIGVPTVRESDGLAMSSRNTYLSASERQKAPLLYKTLKQTKAQIQQGAHDYTDLENRAVATLKAADFLPEYFRICRADDLAPARAEDNDLIILVAVKLGKTRLIDNIRLQKCRKP